MTGNRGGRVMADNDDEPETITLQLGQAALLATAGNLLSELWGDLAAGDRLTLADLDDRMIEAGLAWEHNGIRAISPELTSAVVDVQVALAHGDGGDASGFEADVAVAEAAFADHAPAKELEPVA